jgi:putative peptidoglycan lipid II flippase
MAVATFLSRIMGLVREQSFAYLFGAGIWTDAFNVAFRIPNLLRDLFAEGAMSAAFVPTFNAVLQRDGRDRAFRLTNLTLTALLIIVGALSVLGILLAPTLVGVLAPEFRSIPEKFAVTVTMTRIMFPFLLVISWAAIAMGILNSLGEFFLPAIAPVFLNLAMILAGFLLCPFMPGFGQEKIVGMAIGAMIGGFLQMAVQFPVLYRHGFKLRPGWEPRSPGLRRIARLIIPGTVGLAATQVNVAVSTILAVSQGTGAVSWLGYAFRVMQLPLGIFGVAIAQATLPIISRQAAADDRSAMGNTLAGSIRLTGFINLSAMLFLVALAEPVIRILFQHGRFSPGDTVHTAHALKAYAVGLFFFSIVKVLTPAFYALNDTRLPVKASMVSVVANIGLNLLLIKPCGYWGLALGSSIAAGANSGMLLWFLRRKLPLDGRGIMVALGRSLVAACAGAGVARVMYVESARVPVSVGKGLSLAWECGALAIAAVFGLGALFLMARVLNIAEARQAFELLRKKLRRGNPDPALAAEKADGSGKTGGTDPS